MYRNLDIHPLHARGQATPLCSGAEILRRVVDPDRQAAAVLWHLFSSGKACDTGHLRASFEQASCFPRDVPPASLLRLGRGLGQAGRGAGLLVCADASCLVIRRLHAAPWPRGALDDAALEILPVILELPPVIVYGASALVRCRLDPAPPSLPEIRFDPVDEIPDAEEIERSLRSQICWEATAWGNMIDGLPPLAPEGAWPAAFPGSVLSDEALASFRHRAAQAAQFLLFQQRELLKAVRLKVFSALPLQGAVSPARLTASFQTRNGDVLDTRLFDTLVARLETMIFGGSSPFRADEMIAQRLKPRKDRAHGLSRVCLAEVAADRTPSNHDLIQLHTIFGKI